MEKIPVVEQHIPPLARDGKFHVKLTEGRFQNLRRISSWPLIGLFFILVWVQSNGQPWLLFSFEQREIILFGESLSWHDLPLLAGLMIAGVSALFFMAVAWGRVWCGFACPQSIWTWLFIRIEELTEGRASERARNEHTKLQGKPLLRRLIKHLLWICLAALTAITFTGYFIPIREIVDAALAFELSIAISGWIVIMTLLTYLNAGLVREKICLHACPYSRFQSVMFDEDTLTVSYDRQRGEPRANRRNAGPTSGDCVDCDLCVQVCPTGIDIRDGLQAACIDCAACIDACDSVMRKIKRPTGLIRFASENQLQKEPARFLRPRLAGYGVLVLCASLAVIYGFSDTTSLLVEIRRDRHQLFTKLERNTVCNHYLVKVESFTKDANLINISVQGEGNFQLFGQPTINLQESNSTWLPYRVCATDLDRQKSKLTFNFSGLDAQESKETTFLTDSRKDF